VTIFLGEARVRLSAIIVPAVGLHQVLAFIMLAIVFARLVHLGLCITCLLLPLFNSGRMLFLSGHFFDFVLIFNLMLIRVLTLVVYGVWVVKLFWCLRHHRHVINELIRHLTKHFKRQFSHTQVFEICVLDKLDNISDGFSTLRISEHTSVGIKHLHIFEIAVTNADNDTREWHMRHINH